MFTNIHTRNLTIWNQENLVFSNAFWQYPFSVLRRRVCCLRSHIWYHVYGFVKKITCKRRKIWSRTCLLKRNSKFIKHCTSVRVTPWWIPGSTQIYGYFKPICTRLPESLRYNICNKISITVRTAFVIIYTYMNIYSKSQQ